MVIAFALLGAWDTIVSQFLSPELQQKTPNIYSVLSATTGWLPWWTWVVLGLILISLITIEYSYRISKRLPPDSSRLVVSVPAHDSASSAEQKSMLTGADRERISEALHALDKFIAEDVAEIVVLGGRLAISKWQNRMGAKDRSALIGGLESFRAKKNEVEDRFDKLLEKLSTPLGMVGLNPAACRQALRKTRQPIQDAIAALNSLPRSVNQGLLNLAKPTMDKLGKAIGELENSIKGLRREIRETTF